jgi:hypothetical protein
MTLKYYSHLNLTYTRDLAVQLLKLMQNEYRNLYDRWSEDCCWEDFFLSANTYNRTTQHEELYEREHAKHKACTDLLYIFMMNWDNFISYISRYSYLNISCCNITFFSRISQLYKQSHLKQLIAAMNVNQHLKQCLSDSLRFEEKRVKFRSWLQQIVAKLNVNMSEQQCQCAVLILTQSAWRVDFKSDHTLNCGLY